MASHNLMELLTAGVGTFTHVAKPIATRRAAPPPPEPAPPKLPCIYLGDPTGATALLKCGGCQGNVRLKIPSNACAIFGTCLPTVAHENASGVKGCLHCPRREAEPLAP